MRKNLATLGMVLFAVVLPAYALVRYGPEALMYLAVGAGVTLLLRYRNV